MGQSTISMAIFNSKLLVYQRVNLENPWELGDDSDFLLVTSGTPPVFFSKRATLRFRGKLPADMLRVYKSLKERFDEEYLVGGVTCFFLIFPLILQAS